jgi:hypothetical protein
MVMNGRTRLPPSDSESSPTGEQDIRVDEDGRVVVTSGPRPLLVQTQDENHWRAAGDVSQSHSIPAVATTIDLPVAGGRYRVKCIDNSCFVRWDGGTCTTSVGGFSYCFAEGVPEVIEFPRGVKQLSIIGTVAAGHISLLLLRRD